MLAARETARLVTLAKLIAAEAATGLATAARDACLAGEEIVPVDARLLAAILISPTSASGAERMDMRTVAPAETARERSSRADSRAGTVASPSATSSFLRRRRSREQNR
jgi:hypothetical protein